MKRLASCLVLVLSASMCVSLSGCKASSASDTWPKVLRYAYSPSSEQLQSGSVNTELDFVNILRVSSHIPVEVVRVQGYAPTIEAMRGGKGRYRPLWRPLLSDSGTKGRRRSHRLLRALPTANWAATGL